MTEARTPPPWGGNTLPMCVPRTFQSLTVRGRVGDAEALLDFVVRKDNKTVRTEYKLSQTAIDSIMEIAMMDFEDATREAVHDTTTE